MNQLPLVQDMGFIVIFMNKLFEIIIFRLESCFGIVSFVLGLRRATYPSLEASCTTENQPKLLGNTKPDSFEILHFDW
jgi:hypothetical protein